MASINEMINDQDVKGRDRYPLSSVTSTLLTLVRTKLPKL